MNAPENESANDPPRDEGASGEEQASGDVREDAPATSPERPAGYNPMVPHGSTGPSRAEAASVRSELDEDDVAYAEEETRRNDLVIRWAVVLLALLVAWTPVFQTGALVHVRTGEYLARNGFLPPRTDVFSHAASERTWVNTEWLFDLLVAGVHGSLGPFGLTLLKALLAAVTFGFVVHTVRPGASTWWSSICAAVAVMVCPLRFSALPESITLLGLAIVLWLVVRWRQSEASLWPLVPVFLLWANMDSRMFLGLALLVLYGVGELVSGLLDSPAAFATGDHRRRYWLVTAVCVVVAMANPFGWESLLAPARLYGVVYPELQSLIGTPSYRNLQFFPMSHSEFWRQFDIAGVCGLFLLGAAFVATALNHRRLDVGALFAVAGFTVFAVAAVHELAAAAIVAAVLGSLAAGDWYTDFGRARPTTGSIGFARGGRVLTVLGLIGICVLAMFGRLAGTPRLVLGSGFEHDLRVRIDGLVATMDRVPEEYRGFNATVRQGDLLIWLGRPVFVDGRAALHGAEPSLYTTFLDLRGKLTRDAEVGGGPLGSARTESVLDPHEVDFVMADLRGDLPTDVYRALYRSPMWQPVEIGGDEAVFVRFVDSKILPAGTELEPRAAERNQFLVENGFNPLLQVFDVESEPLDQRGDIGHDASGLTAFLATDTGRTTPQLGRSRSLAKHIAWTRLGILFGRQYPIELEYAFAYITLRESNLALVKDSQQADAYRLLGQTRWFLAFETEQKAFGSGEGAQDRLRGYDDVYRFRRLQAIAELSQAVTVDPDNLQAWSTLLEIHSIHRQYEPALVAAREMTRVARARGLSADDARGPMQALLSGETERLLNERVSALQQEVKQMLADQRPFSEVFQFCVQNGGTNTALATFERDLEKNPAKRSKVDEIVNYVTLLLEAGRLEDALRELGQLERIPESARNPRLSRLRAIAAASAGRHGDAIEILREHRNVVKRQRVDFLFAHLPFVSAASSDRSPNEHYWYASWPVRTMYANTAALQVTGESAALGTLILMLQIESGRIAEARELSEELLLDYRGASSMPLVLRYARMIGTRIDPASLPKPEGEPAPNQGGDTDDESEPQPGDAKPDEASSNEQDDENDD